MFVYAYRFLSRALARTQSQPHERNTRGPDAFTRINQTSPENTAIARGDLEAFWKVRISHQDPVARIGFAMWGSETSLRNDVATADHNALRFWTPRVDILGRIALWWANGPMRPSTHNEISDYWVWMGSHAKTRLHDALEEQNSSGVDLRMHNIGVQLAVEHMKAIDHNPILTASEVRDYHHRVFQQAGLSAHVYGATPHAWIPDAIEIIFARSLVV